jgi:hypothetical protein
VIEPQPKNYGPHIRSLETCCIDRTKKNIEMSKKRTSIKMTDAAMQIEKKDHYKN